MKKFAGCCVLLFFTAVIMPVGAQGHNSVPLGSPAYDLIELGIMRGIIPPQPSARPWPQSVVKECLWEMLDDPRKILTPKETEIVTVMLHSFERKNGLDLRNARYRDTGGVFEFEFGLGLECGFSVDALLLAARISEGGYSSAAIGSFNTASIYSEGNLENSLSWNLTALGKFLFIGRGDKGPSPGAAYDTPSVLPYADVKQWDGGVLSLSSPKTYFTWPENPSLAYGFLGEINAAAFDRRLQARLGRIRRDWGAEAGGSSLFINANALPFSAVECVLLPFSWMQFTALFGALENFRDNGQPPPEEKFTNLLSAGMIEFYPFNFFHFGIGGSAVVLNSPNMAVFGNAEFRLSGLGKIWGSLFVDRLESLGDSFYLLNGNSYAYQAGLKIVVNWLPFSSFTMRYTKIEPYCYTNKYDKNGGKWIPSVSAFVNGGESLGHYLPPNSDEMLLRLESRFTADMKAYLQYQAIRHGVEYGKGAVPGSSLRDKLTAEYPEKYFLMDGVYRWDSVIKTGGSFNLRNGVVPLSIYAEAGLVSTRFTVNGNAGVGHEADYDELKNDPVYRGGNGLVFSVGFRLF